MELRPLVPKPTIPKRETQRRLDFLRERERKKKEELVLAPRQIGLHLHVAVVHLSGFNCEHGDWH